MTANCTSDSQDGQSEHGFLTPLRFFSERNAYARSNMSAGHSQNIPVAEVLAHVVDVHCHPTDSAIVPSLMDSLPIKICAMSVLILFSKHPASIQPHDRATKESDQSLVRDLALTWSDKVIPCFG